MDFNGLIAQVVDTLGQQITTAQATALLPFVEARFNRTINSPKREIEYSFTPTTDPTPLPADLWQLRDVWRTASPNVTLEQKSPDAARFLNGNDTGSPLAYYLSGNNLHLIPAPTATSTDVINLRYQQTIPALSASNTTNWLISSHPDIYYYGLLLQSEVYIVNDERAPMWKAAFDEALQELRDLSRRQRYGAAPLVAKPFFVEYD